MTPENEKAEKEIVIKRKMWAERKVLSDGYRWELVKAQGFKPITEAWSDADLNTFLQDNPDIDPILKY